MAGKAGEIDGLWDLAGYGNVLNFNIVLEA